MTSQSRRPPYVADVEGRARIEGVTASIHESYMDAHGNKVVEDAVFKSPCVVIIFDEAPRYREAQSKHGSKHPIMEAYRDRASNQAESLLRKETCHLPHQASTFSSSIFVMMREE